MNNDPAPLPLTLQAALARYAGLRDRMRYLLKAAVLLWSGLIYTWVVAPEFVLPNAVPYFRAALVVLGIGVAALTWVGRSLFRYGLASRRVRVVRSADGPDAGWFVMDARSRNRALFVGDDGWSAFTMRPLDGGPPRIEVEIGSVR